MEKKASFLAFQHVTKCTCFILLDNVSPDFLLYYYTVCVFTAHIHIPTKIHKACHLVIQVLPLFVLRRPSGNFQRLCLSFFTFLILCYMEDIQKNKDLPPIETETELHVQKTLIPFLCGHVAGLHSSISP